MKKLTVIIGILAVVILAGAFVLRATANEQTLPSLYTNLVTYNNDRFGYGMCGGVYDEQNNFEWLYLHLSTTDQQLVDAKYTELLSTYDFQTMTDAQKTQAISDIKAELVNYINTQGFEIDMMHD